MISCAMEWRFLLSSTILALILVTGQAGKPVISFITKDVVASIGENVEFNCTVDNLGEISVSWVKLNPSLGTPIVLSMRRTLNFNNPRYSISETIKGDSTTYTFKIMKIEAGDMGPYECQASISVTETIRDKLKLSVKHPPIISEERTPKSVVVTEGQNLEVTCYAEAFPQPTLSWIRENNDIMPAGGHIQNGPILNVKEVHRLDRGVYYCIADNGVGQPDKRLVRIEVEFRPQISVQRPKVAQVTSHVAELECSVQGYPAPAVFWVRNGSKLQSDSQYQISNTASSHETTTSVLRIAQVSESDFGDYYCNATNKLGHADARLHLFQPVIPIPSPN